ncbi:phosphate ABC transporter permease subunit PstC [Actinospongicola halichondriae]|uniref:phosphate ABC transporter permease subunit PstC n=1 Tax=Actinospongicola halichondriae TaxID=3236844 RepID=UPI003D438E38
MSMGTEERTDDPGVPTEATVEADRRKPPVRLGDRIFSTMSIGSGVLILVVLVLVAAFLFREALPYFTDNTAIEREVPFTEYVWPLVFGTVYAASLALLFAVIPAIAVALFISHYAPKAIARTLGTVIDLLAAIPSVVYGLWGIFVLAPLLARSVFPFLEDHFGFLPFFGGPTASSGRTMLTAAVVLAVMILPIITAISREVFLQVPRLHEEAALALGATRWEVIKLAVLPYSRSAIISGSMLGLGRALGETMAIAIILSPTDGLVSLNTISTQNSQTIAAHIALAYPESTGLEVNRLFAAGLVLFAITLFVNVVARRITNSRADFSGANG